MKYESYAQQTAVDARSCVSREKGAAHEPGFTSRSLGYVCCDDPRSALILQRFLRGYALLDLNLWRSANIDIKYILLLGTKIIK